MSEFKGTPGPWFVDGFGDVNDTLEIKENTICIAACRGVTDIERDRHNANLIAAAPEMLYLLEWLIDIEGPQPGHAEWAIKVQHVISKALGESK